MENLLSTINSVEDLRQLPVNKLPQLCDELRQFIIGADSPFIGKTLEQSAIRRHYNCMVVGLEEGKENLSSVPPTRQFEEGDILWIVGEQDDLDLLVKAKKH